MAAANTDKFRKVARRFVSQVGGGGISDASTTSGSLASTTGLPTDTAVDITLDRVDSDGNSTSSSEEVVTTVISGSNMTAMLRAQEGTAQAHAAGKVAENLWNAKTWNDAVDGILAEHNQDGTHKETALDSMLAGSEAQGNVIYHNGTVWSQLSPGTSGYFLQTQGAGANPQWAAGLTASGTDTFTNKTIDIESNTITFPSASVYASGNVTVADDAAVTFDSEAWDTNSFHDTGSNTSRLTCASAGKYLITANIQFGAGSDKYIYLKKNGTTTIQYGSRSTGTNQTLSVIVNASANDYYEIFILDTAGGTSNTVVGGVNQSTFQIIKMSD